MAQTHSAKDNPGPASGSWGMLLLSLFMFGGRSYVKERKVSCHNSIHLDFLVNRLCDVARCSARTIGVFAEIVQGWNFVCLKLSLRVVQYSAQDVSSIL